MGAKSNTVTTEHSPQLRLNAKSSFKNAAFKAVFVAVVVVVGTVAIYRMTVYPYAAHTLTLEEFTLVLKELPANSSHEAVLAAAQAREHEVPHAIANLRLAVMGTMLWLVVLPFSQRVREATATVGAGLLSLFGLVVVGGVLLLVVVLVVTGSFPPVPLQTLLLFFILIALLNIGGRL